MTEPIDFKKHQDIKARADKQAQEVREYFEKNGVHRMIPANIDPFNGEFFDEVSRVFYESELAGLEDDTK